VIAGRFHGLGTVRDLHERAPDRTSMLTDVWDLDEFLCGPSDIPLPRSVKALSERLTGCLQEHFEDEDDAERIRGEVVLHEGGEHRYRTRPWTAVIHRGPDGPRLVSAGLSGKGQRTNIAALPKGVRHFLRANPDGSLRALYDKITNERIAAMTDDNSGAIIVHDGDETFVGFDARTSLGVSKEIGGFHVDVALLDAPPAAAVDELSDRGSAWNYHGEDALFTARTNYMAFSGSGVVASAALQDILAARAAALAEYDLFDDDSDTLEAMS